MDKLLIVKRLLLKNKLKSVLTLLSIIISVTIMVAIYIAAENTRYEINRFINENISNSDIIVETSTGDPTYMDSNISRKDSNINDVFERLVFDINSFEGKEINTVRIIGIDPIKEKQYDGIKIISGNIPSNNEILIINYYSKINNVKIGDYVLINKGVKTFHFRVSGIIQSKGLVNQYSQNPNRLIAIMNLCDATKVWGKHQLTSLNIKLKNNKDVNKDKRKIIKAVGKNLNVTLGKEKSGELYNNIQGLFVGLNIFAVLALIVGLFLINNTINALVINSSEKIAILKVIGSTKRDIFVIILGITSVYGIVGSIIGLIGGVKLSEGVIKLLQMSQVDYDIRVRIIPWITIIIICLISVLICILSSIHPALKASNISISQGLSKYKSIQNVNCLAMKTALLISVLMFVIFLYLSSYNNVFRIFIYFNVIILMYLILFFMLKPITKVVSFILKKIYPLSRGVVNFNFIGNKIRTTNTIYVLILSMAISIGFMGSISSYKSSILGYKSSIYGGDILINSSVGFQEKDIRLIKGIEQIQQVVPIYNNYVTVKGKKVVVEAINYKHSKLKIFMGNKTIDESNLNRGRSIVLSTILRKKFNCRIDDKISIPSNDSSKDFKVIGFSDVSQDSGNVVFISENNFRKIYSNIPSYMACVYIKKNYKTSQVLDKIKQLKNNEIDAINYKDYIKGYAKDIDQMFIIFYALMAIGFASCSLVIINSMIMNTYEMKYQLSVFKTLGTSLFQMVKMLAIIGLVYGVISSFMGIVLGTYLNYALLDFIKIVTGMSLDFKVNVQGSTIIMLIAMLTSIITSVVAGYYSYKISINKVIRED